MESPKPSGLAAAVDLFALSGIAFAAPLFDQLSRQAEFLVAHQARPADLVLLALVLCFAPALTLLAAVRTAAVLYRGDWRWGHLAAVAGLSGLIALQALKRLPASPSGMALIAGATALGVAAAACYRRWEAVRSFVTVLAPVTLLFPGFFLFASPARDLLLPATVTGDFEARLANAAPVVMVVLDELPLSSLLDAAGEIDPVRYPNFAALAGDAHWFRDATTVVTDTTLSVPIILSGRLPERVVLPRVEQYPDNLFTWLASAGYRMEVIETHTRLCPAGLCPDEVARPPWPRRLDQLGTDLVVIYLHLLLPDDLASRLPAIDGTWRDFTSTTLGTRVRRLLGRGTGHPAGRRRDNPWLFDRFLESIAPGDEPALHFIHLMLPHLPWKYLPSGREYGPIGMPIFPHGVRNERWGADEWEVIQGYQRHLLQLGFVDRLIGQLIARLKHHDLYEPALIAIVADHGAAFTAAANRRDHPAEGDVADVLNVPFLLKLPGQAQGARSDRNVETIDVLPTLAGALGATLPWPSDGQSALDPSLPERPHKQLLDPDPEGILSRQSLPVATLRAARQRSVTRKLELFGSGATPGGLFRIGRHAGLVGRRVAEIVAEPAAEPPVSIELDQPWSFESVDPGSSFVPAHVTGKARFERAESAPIDLAIAINGTIEAVTRTYGHDPGDGRFTAMVSESALVAGRNLVEVFEIIRRDPPVSVIPTRDASGPSYSFVSDAGKPAIQGSDGRVIRLAPGHLRGKAKIRRTALGTWLSGWAAVAVDKTPAQTLLVFIDDRCVLATANGKRSKDPWRRQAAFRIQLPDAMVGGSRTRLFAVLGDAASEIEIR